MNQGLALYRPSGLQRFMPRFYRPHRWKSDFVYNRYLMSPSALDSVRFHGGRVLRKLAPAGICLAVGALVLPALIYGCGIAALGRYEGGSLAKTYQGVLGGLASGSIASWIVVLGPYLLWQLARLLRAWWQASAKLAR